MTSLGVPGFAWRDPLRSARACYAWRSDIVRRDHNRPSWHDWLRSARHYWLGSEHGDGRRTERLTSFDTMISIGAIGFARRDVIFFVRRDWLRSARAWLRLARWFRLARFASFGARAWLCLAWRHHLARSVLSIRSTLLARSASFDASRSTSFGAVNAGLRGPVMHQGRETPQPEMPRNRGCRPRGSSSGPRHEMSLDSIDLAISSSPSPSAHGTRGLTLPPLKGVGFSARRQPPGMPGLTLSP
jgi:hypothetical protein